MSTANRRCVQRPYTSESTTTEDKETWVVVVPAVDYIRQAFFGALSKLGEPTSYNPLSDVAAEYGSEILASLRQILPPEEIGVQQKYFQAYQLFALANAGAGLLKSTQTLQMFNSTVQMNPAAINDIWSLPNIPLSAGNYFYTMLHVKNTASGLLELTLTDHYDALAPVIQIGGAGVTHDLYSTPIAYNQQLPLTFTIPTTSYYRLAGKVTGKRAASGGYQCLITMHQFHRIG